LIDDDEFARREVASSDLEDYQSGFGRELFAPFRAAAGGAEDGASIWSF
jgi:phosphogluconate dehydratase